MKVVELPSDTMAEWLRRGIRVPMGLSRISSNLVRVVFFFFFIFFFFFKTLLTIMIISTNLF